MSLKYFIFYGYRTVLILILKCKFTFVINSLTNVMTKK